MSTRHIPKTCEYCHADYFASKAGTRFCSRNCAQRARRRRAKEAA